MVKIYESCMVAVSLHQSLEDTSTWYRISHVASQIAAACSMVSYPQGLTGVSTFVGDAGLIKVSVEKYRPLPIGSGNRTISRATS